MVLRYIYASPIRESRVRCTITYKYTSRPLTSRSSSRQPREAYKHNEKTARQRQEKRVEDEREGEVTSGERKARTGMYTYRTDKDGARVARDGASR